MEHVTPNHRKVATSTRFTYDMLDRLTERTEQDLSARWVYDVDAVVAPGSCSQLKSCGKLIEAYTLAGSSRDARRRYAYDSLGRPSSITSIVGGQKFVTARDYDAWGRDSAERHRLGDGTEREFNRRYNNMGQLDRVEGHGRVLWRATTQTASGELATATLGNGMQVAREYNPMTGRLSAATLINSVGVEQLREGYGYDAVGNVSQRTQYWPGTGFIEDFSYDSMNRLERATVTGKVTETFTYDSVGNITSKTGVGDYKYPTPGSPRPHAVTSIAGLGSYSYDANGNLLKAPGRTVSWVWSSFDMPLKTTLGTVTNEFRYGAERERTVQLRNDGTTIYYAGGMELEVSSSVQRLKTYWPMGLGVTIEQGADVQLNWIHADRLGSVVAITGTDGMLREKFSYDRLCCTNKLRA